MQSTSEPYTKGEFLIVRDNVSTHAIKLDQLHSFHIEPVYADEAEPPK